MSKIQINKTYKIILDGSNQSFLAKAIKISTALWGNSEDSFPIAILKAQEKQVLMSAEGVVHLDLVGIYNGPSWSVLSFPWESFAGRLCLLKEEALNKDIIYEEDVIEYVDRISAVQFNDGNFHPLT